MKFFEKTGIELDSPHGKKRVYFKVGLILGDNLGVHKLLGFTESFNSNYACRFCKMTLAQRSMASVEDTTLLRNKHNYDIDLMKHDVSKTGINERCIFHELPGFHVTDNLTVDIMHDCLEGFCMFDLVTLIKLCIEKKHFTLEQLNERIFSYPWKSNCNKPRFIFQNDLNNDCLRMSASEIFTFVLHFGLLIGDCVPKDEPAWQVYVNLRQIVSLVTSTSLQNGCSKLLSSLIREHHVLARDVLKRSLKPKDHFALHMARVMEQSGPLINIWSMRGEAKHQESKLASHSSNSKQNVCETIAIKHQLKLACMLYEKQMFVDSQDGPSYISSFKKLNLPLHPFFSYDTIFFNTSLNTYVFLNGLLGMVLNIHLRWLYASKKTKANLFLVLLNIFVR